MRYFKRTFLTFSLIVLLICILQGVDYYSFAHRKLPSADTTEQITVHFIHGSKPKTSPCAYNRNRMGGLWGGHVEIQVDQSVYGFEIKDRSRRFHWIEKTKQSKFNSHFTREEAKSWQHQTRHEKITSITLPITPAAKEQLLKTCAAYQAQAPFDYAFLGMRCTSTTHKLLSDIGIMPKRKKWSYIFHAFYPKMLRSKMLALAEKNHLAVTRKEGIDCRNWE
jgi:hypothetical protein